MAYEYDGAQYPSVTTITGILDKPMLIPWAANCAVDFIEEHLDVLRGNTSLVDEFVLLIAQDEPDKDRLSSLYNLMRSSENVHVVEGILEQARKAYSTKKDKAADAGTQCHHAIQMYIEGNDPYPSLQCDEARIGFEAFLSWESKNHVEWLESEVEVISVQHGYGGRFDAIAIVNGHRYLIDFKTSKGVYDEHRWQVCAYRQAYNEMLEEGMEPVENLAILHLDKETAEPQFIPIEQNMERYTTMFNYLCMVYYLMKNRRLKHNQFVEMAKNIGKPLTLLKDSEIPF